MVAASTEYIRTIVDPNDAAQSAGLRYVSDADAGIIRRMTRSGFKYARADGSTISDRNVLDTLIRVGNDDYAKQNKSYGLTTLKNRHVAIDGAEVRFPGAIAWPSCQGSGTFDVAHEPRKKNGRGS